MISKIRGYQRLADAYERRWNKAMQQGNITEAYVATEDYKKNITFQEEILKQMDPNSKDYEKAEHALNEQRNMAWEMNNQQRLHSSNSQQQQAYNEFIAKNRYISNEMSKAIDRGDTIMYDSLRLQYEKNIAAQEILGNEMKSEGVDFQDNVHQEKIDLLNKDIDIRNKMHEKIVQREEKGKKVSEEDRVTAEKYIQQVKTDEVDLVKYQNNKQIEKMNEQGFSKESIKIQEEENKRSEQWIESINK